MSKKIVLHVGFDKVGSSSLQKYLSNNALVSPKCGYKYVSVNEKGDFMPFEKIKKISNTNITGYVSSFPHIASKCDLNLIKSKIDSYCGNEVVPILSCEGWARLSQEFQVSNFFKRIDRKATVVFYVRPQVSWLNSAWWQWYNWDDKFLNPTDFFRKGTYGHMDWDSIIGKWEHIENVEEITVRVQPADVVEDFLSLFEIQSSFQQRHLSKNNVSSSPLVLKLLTQFPELRGVHDARIDWQLSEVVKSDTGSTPWVIDDALINEMISSYRASNKKLVNRLSSDQQEFMLNDSHWWNSEAFKNKHYTKLGDLLLNDNEKNILLKQFAEHILKR